MGLRRKNSFIAAWIAVLAILLAALAPAISHAITAQPGCSNGAHEASTKDLHASEHTGETESDSDVAIHIKHCPFCIKHAASFMLLPVTFCVPVVAAGHTTPPIHDEWPHPIIAWLAAQPRAPPVMS